MPADFRPVVYVVCVRSFDTASTCVKVVMSSLLADPDWASYTLGVFVCLNCSGIHRNLPAVSKVKSIRLDRWEDSLVEVGLYSLYYYI